MLIVTQGPWGERIAAHIQQRCVAPPDSVEHADDLLPWKVLRWSVPRGLPQMIDDPEAYLPAYLPPVALLLVLSESVGLTDLTAELAGLCQAQAVLLPVDRHAYAPPGLRRQVAARLDAQNIAYAFPAPFCSLSPHSGQHPLIQAFAQVYGRPALSCSVVEGQVVACQVLREAPCGNSRYVAAGLIGVPAEEAAQQAGLLHQYFPCWAGNVTDPARAQPTLLHIAAQLAQAGVTGV